MFKVLLVTRVRSIAVNVHLGQDVDGVVQPFCGTVKTKPRSSKTHKDCVEFKVLFDADGESVWVPIGTENSRTWSFAT